jgi:hypothetical protein
MPKTKFTISRKELAQVLPTLKKTKRGRAAAEELEKAAAKQSDKRVTPWIPPHAVETFYGALGTVKPAERAQILQRRLNDEYQRARRRMRGSPSNSAADGRSRRVRHVTGGEN